MIAVARGSCNIGSIDDESFRQQAWLCYERLFYDPYEDNLIKLYRVRVLLQDIVLYYFPQNKLASYSKHYDSN